MRLKPVVLLVLVNVLVIGFCWFLVFSDLDSREYDIRYHSDTQVITVEYGILSYRPTYQYLDIPQQKIMVTQGSWTLDFLQLASIIMVLVNVRWVYVNRQELGLTD